MGRVRADEIRLGEVFVGYSLLHGDLQKKAGGWELSAGKNFTQWLSLHADFDAHHQSAAGSLRHQHDILFGPQFSHRTNHFTLFAHSLAGICRATGAARDTGFSYVAGGGMDLDIGVISLRLAQVDFHSANLFGQYQNQVRFSIGAVLHLIAFSDPPRVPRPAPPEKPQTEPSPGRVSVLPGPAPL